MTVLIGALGILIIFGAIIVIHELGHFTAAKLSGMEVYEYSIGFGPVLFKFHYHGTQYSLRLIPIGGYVRIAGMEVGDEDSANGYDKKPFFSKFATLVAGAGMNFVLALVVFILLGMAIGQMVPGNKVIIEGVQVNSPAARTDIRVGDQLVKINDVTNPTIDQTKKIIVHSTGQVTLTLLRDGKSVTVHPVPIEMLMPDRRDGEFLYRMTTGHYIGVVFTTTSGEWRRLGPIESVRNGFYGVTMTLVDAVRQFASIVAGRIPLKMMSGPPGIINALYTTTKSENVSPLWFSTTFQTMAFLSVLIGFFNLLPLPALDGGRILFLVIEGIRRKPMDRDREAMIHAIGLVVLLGLIVIISAKDIWQWIGGKF